MGVVVGEVESVGSGGWNGEGGGKGEEEDGGCDGVCEKHVDSSGLPYSYCLGVSSELFILLNGKSISADMSLISDHIFPW